MKISVLSLSLFLCCSLFGQNKSKLLGNWYMDSIIVSSRVLVPQDSFFYLNINDSIIEYSIGANQCESEVYINDKEIKSNSGIKCTEIGGDESRGEFYKHLMYSGIYELSNNSTKLLIRNDYVVSYLSRKRENINSSE